MPGPAAQTLLVDADDTLWENHAYFLEVLSDYLDLMEERGHARETVITTLRAIEAHRTRTHGYGSINYALSLGSTVEKLEGAISDDLLDELMGLGRWIYHHEIELFPGVRETLESLSGRHRLLLVTKGDRIEQLAKIERSGIASLFHEREVLPEKETAAYVALCERHALDKPSTWMIGNSPRSDINPAKAAGLRTIYIPHRSLWEFEREDLNGGPDLHLAAFRDLLSHF